MRHPSGREQGAALVMVLCIMLALMIVGVSAARSALNAEKASRAERDRHIAFQAAEAGRTAMFKKMDNIHSLLLSKSEGAALSGDKVDIDSMRYCAQMTKGPLVLYQRDGRVDSNSLGPNSVKTYVVFVDSQGTYSNDSNCDEALARHESGFAIKTL